MWAARDFVNYSSDTGSLITFKVSKFKPVEHDKNVSKLSWDNSECLK